MKIKRETCEKIILQKLREIRRIAQLYDDNPELHLSICVKNDYISCDNAYWKCDAPISIVAFDYEERND